MAIHCSTPRDRRLLVPRYHQLRRRVARGLRTCALVGTLFISLSRPRVELFFRSSVSPLYCRSSNRARFLFRRQLRAILPAVRASGGAIRGTAVVARHACNRTRSILGAATSVLRLGTEYVYARVVSLQAAFRQHNGILECRFLLRRRIYSHLPSHNWYSGANRVGSCMYRAPLPAVAERARCLTRHTGASRHSRGCALPHGIPHSLRAGAGYIASDVSYARPLDRGACGGVW